MPERSRAAFYRALKALRARSVIATRGGPGKWKGKWEINRAIDEWKNRAGDGLLFSENSPESLGYSRRLTDNKPATETPRRPRKLPRVKPTREENRVDDDENGDQPGQRHITDPAGTDLNQKEPDIWDKAIARLKAAHRDP
ncbi:MAG: hypothetical protein IID54_06605 [Proteobacteria bacterium]|nr:hypothetical protein [Pseudomonadota bacterium]